MTTTISIHDGRTDSTPKSLGFDPQRLELLDEHFKGLIEGQKIQGASYLVSRDGQIAVHRSLGKLTYHEGSLDLMPDSIRKVYSITKAFTAVAIAQLVEEGKLFYQQSVSSLIKEFDTDMHRRITIWNLLTHTSGLMADPGCQTEPYELPFYLWHAYKKKESQSSWEASDWIKIILGGRMFCKPGEQWNYCTAGYVILGEVIATASGMPYEQYIQEKILGPLGLDRSFMTVPGELKAETCIVNQWGEKELSDLWDLSGLPAQAGNGLYSTVHDLWTLGQTLLDGGTRNGVHLLGRRTIQNMVSNQLHNIPSTCWGDKVKHYPMSLGWNLNHNDICTPGTFSHEGHGHSGLYVDPTERIVYTFFVPSKAGWVPEAIINPRAIIWSALL
jgi:CubicO group peptidase (beta-lactamase class C family)